MAKHGKGYNTVFAKVDREREYEPREAIALVKECTRAKFDETVEVHIRTGLNVRHAEEQLRGTIALPHGLGKDVKIIVFAKGPKAAEAEAAGADEVGADDLAKKIEEGFTDFDVAIATPDMMPVVGRLGKILGPSGKMPNPKVGTVTMDVAAAVKASKGGAVEFRVEKAGIVHGGVGKVSFDANAIAENIRAFTAAVIKATPTGAKGNYVKKISLTSTTVNIPVMRSLPPVLNFSEPDTIASIFW